MNLRFFIFIILLFCVSIAEGQKNLKKGFIITLENDTIHGAINLRSNITSSKMCEFLDSTNLNLKTYSPKEIKAYKIQDDKFYVSKQIDFNNKKSFVFLEYLVDGIVDLYFYKEKENNIYFIEKDGVFTELTNDEIRKFDETGTEYTKSSNKYVGVLKYLFQDSPELSNQITETNFNTKSLVNITKDYHSYVCGEDCIDYTKNSKSNIFLEISTGASYCWINAKNSSHNYAPFIGIFFKLNPVKARMLNLTTGINYFKIKYNHHLVLDAPFKELIRYKLNSTFISIPLILELSFPMGKFQPYAAIGWDNSFHIASNSFIKSSVLNEKGQIISTVNKEIEHRKYIAGYIAKAGIMYNLKNNSYLFIESNFEKRDPYMLNNIYFKYSIYSLTLNLGYGFNLNK